MTAASIGPVVHAGHVEQAAISILKLWMPFYLARFDDLNARPRGTLKKPRASSYIRATDIDTRFPEDHLPVVAVACPNTSGRPLAEGGGNISSSFELGVGVVVAATTRTAATGKARDYTACVRMVLLQQGLPGLADSVDLAEEADEEVRDKDRILQAGVATFQVMVARIANRLDGPTGVPPVDPTVPSVSDPTVLTTHVTVT